MRGTALHRAGLRHALQLGPGIVLVVIWQLWVAVKPEVEFFFGAPSGIIREFKFLLLEEKLLFHAFITASEAVLGFIAGCSIGTAVGLGLWGSERLYEISKPYLIALGSVPVFAFGPVLIFWFGTGIASKVALGFLSTFVIAVVQAHTGAREADDDLLRVVQAFGGTRSQAFRSVIIPSATIWVLSGVRLNIGMALLGAFIGEFISARMGLGHLIIVAEGLYNVNQIWVGAISIVLIAIVFHSLTTPVEEWARRWK